MVKLWTYIAPFSLVLLDDGGASAQDLWRGARPGLHPRRRHDRHRHHHPPRSRGSQFPPSKVFDVKMPISHRTNKFCSYQFSGNEMVLRLVSFSTKALTCKQLLPNTLSGFFRKEGVRVRGPWNIFPRLGQHPS